MAPPPPGTNPGNRQTRGQNAARVVSSDIAPPVAARANAGGAAPFVLWASEPERRNSIEFADITAVLQRRRWVILLTFLVVAGLAAIYLMLTPPVYEARAYLQARVAEGENDLLAQ